MTKFLRLIFLLGIFISSAFVAKSQTTTTLEQHILNLQATVQTRRSLTSELRSDSPHVMPVGILGKGGGEGKPPIILDDVVLYPTYAEFKAYAVVTLPGATEPMYFATVNPIKLSYNGGILGTARIDLVNDKKVKLMNGDAEFTVLKGKSYVEFDCKGFKRAGLGISVNMPKKLVPEDKDGNQLLNQRVKGYFSVEFSDLNDILASVSIDPFQVSGTKGVTFTVTDAIIDLSDLNNSPNMAFPKGYQQDYFDGVDLKLWRGFYVKSLSVKLPQEIKDRSKNRRCEIQTKNVLIDSHGFSGEIIAKNLISLENGDLGGWNYSVDSIYVNLRANQLTGAGIAGGLNIPISGDTTKLAYKAIFKPGEEYLFNVATTKDMSFDIFKAANVKLKKGSFVEVALKNKKFEVLANLSGSLNIGANLSGEKNETKEGNKFSTGFLGFEQLVISTRAPFIHSGTFSLDVTVKIGTFTGSISNVKIVKKDDNRGLGFDFKVGLLNSKDANSSFSADASLMILGKVVTQPDESQHYQYVTTQFNRVHVEIDQGNFYLNGELNFFKEDETFGSGFKGKIIAGITAGIDIKLGATVLFGSVAGNKYWYADALAELDPGIPIAGPIQLYGFAGGLYYGVKQKPGNGGNIAVVNSQTGLAYLPDANAGLGVRAAIMMALVNKSLLNGNIGFEIAFNKNGGLSRAMLMGNLNMLQQISVDVISSLKNGSLELSKSENITEAEKLAKNSSTFDSMNTRGQLSASVFIDWDVDNRSLYASYKTYVNLIQGIVKGVSAGGMAGGGELFFSPSKWYVHAGTPDQPLGLEWLWLYKSKSYFMVGSDLPGSPPPPQNVSEILGGKNLDYMRDLNALKSGMGMAFGASFGYDTGDISFLIFYARFAAGAGFDVMLKNYGSSVHCESESGPIGINGWYANGQVYAYIQGKIGIQVKLFGKKRKFPIIDLGVAAVLQAKLPNPTWIHGVVGGRYRILGGLIKGSCSFEFTVGKECKLVGGNAFANAGIEVIADVSPNNNDKEVDVFAIPQAVFNVPIGEHFNVDNNGSNSLFRAKLDFFKVTSGGIEIPGTMAWNADKTTVAFTSTDILPSKKEVSIATKISFEENNGGAWTPYVIDGKNYTEERLNTFTTREAPDHIPQNNVAYSYPVINQLNYYKKEAQEGYIKLKRGQPGLFESTGEFTQIGRIMAEGGDAKEFQVSYTDNQINYVIPEIENNKGYEFAIIGVPKNTDASIDRNIKTTEQKSLSEGGNDLTVTTKSIEGTIKKAEEKSIYGMSFRSSAYSTFAEKIDKASAVYSYTWALSNGLHELGYVFTSPELFDDQEMNDELDNHLIHLEAILADNNWYNTHIYPYVYENYPADPALILKERNPGLLGTPPTKAMYIKNEGMVTGLKYTPGASSTAVKVDFVYNLPFYIHNDYSEIQGKIVNAYAAGKILNISAKMKDIATTPFMPVRKGPYKFKVIYMLPGIKKITTVKELVINNEIGY